MKVKIKDKIYDSENEPIMLILNEEDKELISNMCRTCTKYCSYPTDSYWTKNNHKHIKEWMDYVER